MRITLIVKVSKLCNLRCVYCYETPELANRARMSLENIQKMFLHVRDHLRHTGKSLRSHQLELIWHGGEPFVQPLSYWQGIIGLERSVFGTWFRKNAIVNRIQSNLTRLTEKHLPLIRRFFALGFSYDVINDLRLNAGGQPTADIVEKTVEWLRSEGIPLGGIAVISACNVDSPDAVARYFLERNLNFRVLNVNEGHSIPQVARTAVPYDSYLKFLAVLYHLPAVREAMKTDLVIEPLSTARSMLDDWKHGRHAPLSEEACSAREWALAVDTNGDVYPAGECYNATFRYGNIFCESLDELLFSEARKARIEQSRARLRAICHNCFLYRKGCLGTFVSHATPEEFREYDRRGECYHAHLAKIMKEDP